MVDAATHFFSFFLKKSSLYPQTLKEKTSWDSQELRLLLSLHQYRILQGQIECIFSWTSENLAMAAAWATQACRADCSQPLSTEKSAATACCDSSTCYHFRPEHSYWKSFKLTILTNLFLRNIIFHFLLLWTWSFLKSSFLEGFVNFLFFFLRNLDFLLFRIINIYITLDNWFG